MIMTTAGLARKTADWSSDSVAASGAEGAEAARKQAITAIAETRVMVEIVPSLPCRLKAWMQPRGSRFTADHLAWVLIMPL
jgi:hypothetical protein